MKMHHTVLNAGDKTSQRLAGYGVHVTAYSSRHKKRFLKNKIKKTLDVHWTTCQKH